MPTYGEIAQILTAVAAIGALLNSLRNGRKLSAVVEKVDEVHLATNSITDRLVETTKTEAHAAGLKEGRGEQR
jgi:hypothetical protein